MTRLAADPGSFRDPLNRVFVTDEAVVRAYRADAVADLEALTSSAFFTAAVERGDLVATQRVESADVPGTWDAYVEHERVPVITYPYEWTFSMLREAALLQLRLTREALADGLITKDATPYNIQFVGTRPVFIDVGSFEEYQPGDPWYGYRQFCQLFLNPLLLRTRLDVPFQPWLRGSLSGIDPSVMASLLPFTQRFRRGTFTHVTLHARSERKHADSDRDVSAELKRAGFGSAIIDAQLGNLIKVVERMTWERERSTWSDYSDRSHYSDVDLKAKERFVLDVVAARPRDLVWDLGANDGRFSSIAAEHSETVLAVDSDALVVDRLFQRLLRQDGNDRITPLVMDLIDSSPPLGWRSQERSSFYGRTSPDVVLALALVHHLAIPGTVPPEQIVEWFTELSTEVVVEVPHRDDPMVQRLLRTKRSGVFDHYRLETFDALFRERFVVRDELVLPSGARTLYHLAPLA